MKTKGQECGFINFAFLLSYISNNYINKQGKCSFIPSRHLELALHLHVAETEEMYLTICPYTFIRTKTNEYNDQREGNWQLKHKSRLSLALPPLVLTLFICWSPINADRQYVALNLDQGFLTLKEFLAKKKQHP